MEERKGLATYKRWRRKPALQKLFTALVVLGLVVGGTKLVGKYRLEQAYQRAVALYDAGEYGEAFDRFLQNRELWSGPYKDTVTYISLCNSHLSYEKGVLTSAYFSLPGCGVTLLYGSAAQRGEAEQYAALVIREYKAAEKAEREQAPRTDSADENAPKADEPVGAGPFVTEHDTYQQGYEDVSYGETFDEEHYRNDPHYATGVDDAMEDDEW